VELFDGIRENKEVRVVVIGFNGEEKKEKY